MLAPCSLDRGALPARCRRAERLAPDAGGRGRRDGGDQPPARDPGRACARSSAAATRSTRPSRRRPMLTVCRADRQRRRRRRVRDRLARRRAPRDERLGPLAGGARRAVRVERQARARSPFRARSGPGPISRSGSAGSASTLRSRPPPMLAERGVALQRRAWRTSGAQPSDAPWPRTGDRRGATASRARRDAAADRRRGPGRALRGRDRGCDRLGLLALRGRSRGAPLRMGRAAAAALPRRRGLRAAAERPGRGGADRARALRRSRARRCTRRSRR